jgi:hypothetical protein
MVEVCQIIDSLRYSVQRQIGREKYKQNVSVLREGPLLRSYPNKVDAFARNVILWSVFFR